MFAKVVIQTSYAPEAAVARVARLIRPRRGLLDEWQARMSDAPRETAPFVGRVYATTFDAKRIIRYRNSFLPHIHGSVETAEGGSTVVLRMRVSWFVLAFTLCWFGGLFFVLLRGGGNAACAAPLVVAFGVLGAILIAVGFGRERRIAEELFRKALL
jgi:hypothetical protein